MKNTRKLYNRGGNRTRKALLQDCIKAKDKMQFDLSAEIEKLKEMVFKQNEEFSKKSEEFSKQFDKQKHDYNSKFDKLKDDYNSKFDKQKENYTKKFKKQDKKIDNLEENLIVANIITSIQDLNRYRQLERNKKLNKGINIAELQKLRDNRNDQNHFIKDNDDVVESETKMKFMYDKLLKIQEKRPEIITTMNSRYGDLISQIIELLSKIHIDYDAERLEEKKEEYNAWWNKLPLDNH